MVHPLIGAAAGAYSAKKAFDFLGFGDDEEDQGPRRSLGELLREKGILLPNDIRFLKEKGILPEDYASYIEGSPSSQKSHYYDYESHYNKHYKSGGAVNKKSDPSLLVHLNKEECRSFDLLQGGMKVLPVDDEFSQRMAALGFPILEGQIRDYRPLAKVIADPAVKKIFLYILTKMDEEGEDSPELEHYYELGKKGSGHFKDVPEHDPELKHLADQGTSGDTEIVYMPLSVCDFMDGIRGKPKTNQNTGFPEYGGLFGNFFKGNPVRSIARVVGTVGGFMIGGPAGAMAGNALGRMATGQKPMDAMWASAPNFLYGVGAQGLGHLAGTYGTGALATMGNSVAGMGGSLSSAGMLNSLTGGSGTGAGAVGTAGKMSGGELELLESARKSAGLVPSSSGSGGILSSLFGGGNGSSLLSTAAPLALAAYGAHSLGKGRRDEMAAWEKENQRARREREEMRERLGMNDKLFPLQDDNEFIEKPDFEKMSKRHFKKGGLTPTQKKGHQLNNYVAMSESYNGKNKGQLDNLKKKLPINGYIIPADVVSMVGDGNTNAGQAILKKEEQKVLKKYKGMRVNKKLATLKAKTSDGEHQFSPLYVTLIGGHNNDKGSKKLDYALQNIRHEKIQNGVHLQPKAKPFESYFR